MKTLFLDCGMGVAGDMLCSALLELMPNPNEYIKELNTIGIPRVTILPEKTIQDGIRGMRVSIMVNGRETLRRHHHSHRRHQTYTNLFDIKNLVAELSMSHKVKSDVISVFNIIAEAKSRVLNIPVNEVVFGEESNTKAVARAIYVCYLMDKIAPDNIVVSPIQVGISQVEKRDGDSSAPSPLTAQILRGVPVYSDNVKGELCTTVGAALLKYFACSFGDMPVMEISTIGYGMSKKDFGVSACVRAMLGETEKDKNSIIELTCNIDDMTSEAIDYATDCLFDAGILEAYTMPINMRNNHLGTLLRIVCSAEIKENVIHLLFKHTTAFNIRETVCKNYALSKTTQTISTNFGEVRQNILVGFGVTREKYEYDDISRIAKEQNMSIEDTIKAIELNNE